MIARSQPADELRWTSVASLLAIALAARVALVLAVPSITFGDIDEYIAGADRLLAGQPLALQNQMFFIRAPGYSTFIALVWLVTGTHSLVAVKLAQCLAGTATCFYVYRLALVLGAKRIGGAVALAGAALYPYLLYQTAAPATEAIFSPFVAASSYYLATALTNDRPSLRRLALAGVLLAAGNLIRPNLSTVLPLMGVWIALRFRRRPVEIVRIGATLLISIVLTTLPWTLSVYRHGDGLMWVSDGAGIWYWLGHNDTAERLYCGLASPEERHHIIVDLTFDNAPYVPASKLPRPERSSAFWNAGLTWDRAHPRSLPCLMLGKSLAYLRPWVEPTVYPRSRVLISLSAVPVLLLGAYGWWLARRRGERVLTTLIAIGALTGVVTAALFSTEIRYRIPIVDLPLLACAGYAVERLLSRRRENKASAGA